MQRSGSGRWVLAATILGSSMAFIDGTVVNIALPVLQTSLRATVSQAQWVVEAYSLFLSSLVLVGGALADRLGRRRIFLAGAGIFAASSLACGLAVGIRTIVIARSAQGIGAALLVPSSLAILGASFAPADRGRAVGTWSSLTAIATAIGPALGGWLVQAVSWRAVFLLNLPIAAAVVMIAVRHVPETHSPSAGALDWTGALLATLGLGSLVFGLIEEPGRGWTDALVVATIAGGVAALAAFVAVEGRGAHPMVPPALFRIRAFTAANLLTLFLYAALSASLFFLPFDLIQARGYSASAAGAAILPLVLLMFLLSRWAGALADRLGARLPLTVGPAVAAAGFLLLGVLSREASYAKSVLPALCVLGLGMAITVAPLTATVLNAVDRDDEGSASGINNAVARVAALLAIAVFGVVATVVFNRSLDRRLDAAAISPATRQALAPERSKLGAMRPPAGAGEAEARAVESAVKSSFGSALRVVYLCSAGLALLAAACGALGIGPKAAAASPPRKTV